MSQDSQWKPKHTMAEVDKMMTAPGSPLEMETLVDGQVQRVWKNLWPSTRLFWLYTVQEHGDKTCTVLGDRRYTYKDIHLRALKVASVFRDVYGVKKGDRVALCIRNYPDYFTFFWASQLIGAVAVLLNAWLPEEPLHYCISKTQCSIVILDPERSSKLAPVVPKLKSTGLRFVVIENPSGQSWSGIDDWDTVSNKYQGNPSKIMTDDPKLEPEDNATIIFTSGTSGLPKGVLSSHRAFLTIVFNALSIRARAMLRNGEDPFEVPDPSAPQRGVLLGTPLFHVTGTSLMLLAAAGGEKIVLMTKWNIQHGNFRTLASYSTLVSNPFDCLNFSRLMKDENITTFAGVPATVSDLADSVGGHPLTNVSYGGAPVSDALAPRARKAFPDAFMSQAYGMTETNATSVANGQFLLSLPTSIIFLIDVDVVTHIIQLAMIIIPGGRADLILNYHQITSGLPTPVNDVLVMLNGKRCPVGVPGEVWMRGPNGMKGYWGDPVATAETLTKDGWVKSGDIGYLDEEGFLYINGRLKDMIIRGGENVDPVSIENALHRDDRLFEVAAVGVPDERLGELVTAVVTVKPAYKGQVKEAELIAFAQKHLPKFAVPVMVIVYDGEFEHTPSEKILKPPLKKIAEAEWRKRQAAGGGSPARAKL
ncbi:hypothetical protein D9758_004482 [Tetrapyrgos nigripes]|uniref:Uncharacterized protein n=1 Tax=Tetrapyrgos nigripes TaxID=182062 RepID=A0A8H5GN29_9AGAR|nr:hypothetical protein D9758_004482 [Tetrapyrgos nigripes]